MAVVAWPRVIKRFEVYLVTLDQIRTVDRSRLVKRLGRIDNATRTAVLATLAELFAP